MNIHFQQVEKKSQLFSYILAAFAVFTVLMLTLSIIRHTELHLSSPSVQAVSSENTNVPVAIPAPLPPDEQAQTIATPEPFGNSQTVFVPQAIAAPMPSVP